MDQGHGRDDKDELDIYVLHEVSSKGYNCLLHCVISAFSQQGLKWTDVTNTITERLAKMLELAGLKTPFVIDKYAEGYQTKIHNYCVLLDKSPAAPDLRHLLRFLLKFFVKVSDMSPGSYNEHYPTTDVLSAEERRVKGGEFIEWYASMPLLTDFLFPHGKTAFFAYARLFPGVVGWNTKEGLNKHTVHTVHPDKDRLSKLKMQNAHFTGENVYGDEALDAALARKELHVHRFTHCQCGDIYGATPGGTHDHYVTMESVSKITETTTKTDSAKWAVGILNAARAGLPEHLR